MGIAEQATSQAIKTLAARILDEKKARDVVVIDVENVTVIAEAFVICSGTSTTHIKALADEVEKAIESEFGMPPKRREGYGSARWILLDYGDVVIHVFHENDRKFYDLERLWSEGAITRIGAADESDALASAASGAGVDGPAGYEDGAAENGSAAGYEDGVE